MGWTYRVMRVEDGGDGEPLFGIHEVYDADEGGELVEYGWADAIVQSDSVNGLRETLGRMHSALTKPVLDEENGEPFDASSDKEGDG